MEVGPSWEVGHWQQASKGYIQSLVPTFLPASCLTLDEQFPLPRAFTAMASGLPMGSESMKPRTVGESLKPQVKLNSPLKLLCQVF